MTEAAKQAEKAKPGSRSMLIDVVRGMAISLVALGHTNQGIEHRGWWGRSVVGWHLDVTIYSFHMPAFFFVSGIFLVASVAKRGPSRYTIERVRSLLYPYLLWSVISESSVRLLARFVAQRPQTLGVFLLNLVKGAGIWFLPALFLCQMIGMALRKLPGVVLLAISLVLYYAVPDTHVTFVTMALQYLPFVAAGMWVGRSYQQFERVPRWAAALLAMLLLGVLLRETWTWWTTYKNIVLLTGTTGTMMLLMLARWLGGSRTARVLAWAGEASIAIYLAGEYGQGLVRQLLVLAHVTEPYAQLIVPTIAAIAVPAWVYQHRVRLRLEWLFVAPFWSVRPGERAGS